MNNKLLKVAALALVLVFGSMGEMVGASSGSQPGSSLYPVGMAVGEMGLTVTAGEVTETKPQMEFAQEQADRMQRLADDGRDDAYLGGNCALAKDRDRDRTCDCDDCDPARDRDRDCTCDCDDCDPARDRDRDRTCDSDDCDPARDRDRDRTCDSDDCDPARDRDRDGGHSGGQGGGGRH
ncbi:MAG: hypothetical protein ISS49_09055 [Anaerolineae bacterium]|nr:hypothetical protein [Anaerolineae bacterium]